MATPFAGRFALVDPLGEGGSGVVWRAWDLREHEYTAAKVLRQVDSATLVRFMREQSTRISHRHVLVPTGWAGEDDRVLLTMPLVDGGSVADLVGDFWPLPDPWVARIAHQTLLALQAIHSAGVIHRDVTPANLLLDATGTGEPRLRLSDFGIAQHRRDPRLTTGMLAVGTPGFRSPESVSADPHPSHDVYALGATLAALTDSAWRARLTALMTHRDPVQRPSVERLLAEIEASGLLEQPTGEEVEVFDHLPPLPDGWGPGGPLAPRRQEHGQASSGHAGTAVAWRGWPLLVGSSAALTLGAAALVAAVLS